MAPADASVHAILIVRPVARDRGYRARDLVEQGADLVTVVNLAARQRCGDDLARVGIHTEVQFLPGPACAGTVLLDQPLAGPTQLQARAVHQQMQGSASRPASGLLPDRGRGTSRVAARRLRVVWSGTERSRPSRRMTEPISPSVCRYARRNTALNVSAVRIARSEYSGCPPRLVRRSASHASTASSENQTVKLPRRRRLSS